ncbi:Exportin 7, partial [Nowakowskiella sp. JEL0078]
MEHLQQPYVLSQIEEACYVVYNPGTVSTSSIKGSIQPSDALRTLSLYFPNFTDSTSPLSSSSGTPVASSPLDAVFHCQLVLENSTSPYAKLYAASHLKSIAVTHFSLLNITQRIDLRSFVLDYLFRNPNSPPVVITNLSAVFCVISKFAWFDDEKFKAALPDLSTFLHASIDHKI